MDNDGSIDTKLGSLSSFLEAQKTAIDRIETHARDNIRDLFAKNGEQDIEIERLKGDLHRAQSDIAVITAASKEDITRTRDKLHDVLMVILAALIGWVIWNQQQRTTTAPPAPGPTLSLSAPEIP